MDTRGTNATVACPLFECCEKTLNWENVASCESVNLKCYNVGPTNWNGSSYSRYCETFKRPTNCEL